MDKSGCRSMGKVHESRNAAEPANAEIGEWDAGGDQECATPSWVCICAQNIDGVVEGDCICVFNALHIINDT